mmetsp:Transcript_14890/g.27522  ORF Transcript_14890/g.27522 Transcript_14890/m.27522 type:complete len:196 (+) Transcript_14890:671-1258(+)
MVSRGEAETVRLRTNIEAQLNRLLTQMNDLEELRDELEEDEYTTMKADTLAQLREFERQLERLKSGDMSLIDEINTVQIAIQQAVAQAFKTPDVIKMFAAKQPQALRERLTELERDFKLGKVSKDKYKTVRKEILTALKKLGAELTEAEEELLSSFTTAGRREEVPENAEVDESAIKSNLMGKAMMHLLLSGRRK